MLTWIAGAWGVFAGLVLSLATTFYAETEIRHLPELLTLGVLLAALGLPLLVIATARLAESGWISLTAWAGWIVGTITLGTKTSTGSLILVGDSVGNVTLYSGALLGAIAVGFSGASSKGKPSVLEGPALPVPPVDDGDAEGGQSITQAV
jgi:hypothetical protein